MAWKILEAFYSHVLGRRSSNSHSRSVTVLTSLFRLKSAAGIRRAHHRQASQTSRQQLVTPNLSQIAINLFGCRELPNGFIHHLYDYDLTLSCCRPLALGNCSLSTASCYPSTFKVGGSLKNNLHAHAGVSSMTYEAAEESGLPPSAASRAERATFA